MCATVHRIFQCLASFEYCTRVFFYKKCIMGILFELATLLEIIFFTKNTLFPPPQSCTTWIKPCENTCKFNIVRIIMPFYELNVVSKFSKAFFCGNISSFLHDICKTQPYLNFIDWKNWAYCEIFQSMLIIAFIHR